MLNRTRRVLLIVVAIVAAGYVAFIVVYPFFTDARRKQRSWEEGKQLVEAVYQYRDRTGKWPADLTALVPGYLPAVPVRWTYRPASADSGPLLVKRAAFHTYFYYYFPPAADAGFPAGVDRGWVEDDEGQRRYLGP